MDKPLKNIRVLDLTHVLAGPFASMTLGDLGAEIIKIEIPCKGDSSREFGPFINGESAYFMSLNRGKKSVTLNLKTEKGREILKKLAKHCDVIITNFRPGTLDRLSVGYEELKKINPKIVYATCSGFGGTGPYSQRPAYDMMIQGMGGIMSITGEPKGLPIKIGVSMASIIVGLFTAAGILSALHVREQTGKGQKVDISMLDCQAAILENAIARYFATGIVPGPLGSRHPSITPFEAFKSSDHYVVIAVGSASLWTKFCEAIDRKDLINDPKFKNNVLRTKNHQELKKIIETITKTKTTGEWIQIFEQNGVPSSPINTIDKMVQHPQIKSRNMIVELEHPTVGKIKVAGLPIKLSETPGIVDTAPPILGQHTEEILSKLLGINKKEVKQLRKEGVV